MPGTGIIYSQQNKQALRIRIICPFPTFTLAHLHVEVEGQDNDGQIRKVVLEDPEIIPGLVRESLSITFVFFPKEPRPNSQRESFGQDK